MNLSQPFILRPVATTLMMVAILLSGLMALRALPLAALPQVDYPTLQVSTLYPGASADVMASTVTAPLERQFGQMPGLLQMSSTSAGGASSITLQFDLAISMDTVEQQVQAAINAAAGTLPADTTGPPVYSKVNPADAPVLTLAVSSPTMDLPDIEELVSSRVASRIAQLPGVGMVALGGAQRPAVRIRVDPARAAARGLTLDDVRIAVAAANVNAPKGTFNGPLRSVTVDANDQLRDAPDYADLVIAWKAGGPVRVRDIGVVADGAENNQLGAWVGARTAAGSTFQQPAVILNVQRQPGANVIATVERIQALLPALRATLPGSVEVNVVVDRTVAIRAALGHVQFELLLAVVLVVAVIRLFLHSWRATLIPAVVVPLSLVGTLGVMFLAGYSLNNLTLMALTIATGFVVDDAIVMIENIARHMERGRTPLQAALEGARQIGFTILSLTLSLVAVLIPLLFMGDVVGRLFREFAVTLAVAVLISGFVSLTLTPMMAARLLRPGELGSHEALPPGDGAPQPGAARPGLWSRFQHRYLRALTVVLRHRPLTLLVALATVVLTVVLYLAIPKGLFPVQDTGVIQVVTEADQGVSYAAMARHQQRVVDAILTDPDVRGIASVIGLDGVNSTLNTGRLLIGLRPRDERSATAADIIRRLQPVLQEIPGVVTHMQPVQDLTIEARPGRTQYQFTLLGPDAEELGSHIPGLLARLRTVPQLADVTSDLQDRGLQAWVDIDRDQAARLGVSTASVVSALYDAFGQRPISSIFTQSALYRVILEAAPPGAGGRGGHGLDTIEKLYVRSSAGQPVPLASIVRVEERLAPLAQNRLDQFPAVTVSFNLAPGAALSDAVAAVRLAARDAGLPGSVQARFQGAALAFEDSLSSMVLLILASLVTLYIVLGILYESYIHPITILSTLPSAGVGALLALDLAGHELGVVAIIGLILLIGIVKKNAIMMIDFALEAIRMRGLTPEAAIVEACMLRLRPILMTTLAAVLGAVPLMFGQGDGSELRQPLGVALVAGLLVSQVLTLFTTPVIFLAFDRIAPVGAGQVAWDTEPDGRPAAPTGPHA